MPYGQRGTRYYSREAVREESRLFFLDERVQGQGWAWVVSFIRVKSMRVVARTLQLTRARAVHDRTLR